MYYSTIVVCIFILITSIASNAQHTPTQRHLLSVHLTTSGSGAVSIYAPETRLSLESSSTPTLTGRLRDSSMTTMSPRSRHSTSGPRLVSRFASRFNFVTKQGQRKRELNDLHHSSGELISMDELVHPVDQRHSFASGSISTPKSTTDDEYLDVDLDESHTARPPLIASTTPASVVVSPPKVISRKPVLRSNGSHILSSASNRLADYILASQHMSYVLQVGRCKTPSARLVSLKSLFPDRKLRKLLPHCALLHRCEADSGCCGSEHESCQPKSWHQVQLPFWSIELTSSGQSRQVVEWLKFDNHTECECKPIVGIRK